MRAVGRIVDRLAGDYITAEDVGTSPEDMVTIGERTSWVAGQPKQHGGSGDPSPVTARTVFAAIAAAARVRLKAATLEGIRVGVIGVGHVGRSLVELLCAAGAHVLLTDIDAGRATEVAMLHGAHVRPLEGFLESDLDVLAPCALGGAIRQEDIPHLRCAIVAGAANNPLRDPGRTAPELARAGILYVPDFLANCGGIIYVGGQILGYEAARVESLIEAAIERTEAVLTTAMASDRVPQDLAVEQALARLRRDEPPPSA
jgi:leucine dehydrogenase